MHIYSIIYTHTYCIPYTVRKEGEEASWRVEEPRANLCLPCLSQKVTSITGIQKQLQRCFILETDLLQKKQLKYFQALGGRNEGGKESALRTNATNNHQSLTTRKRDAWTMAQIEKQNSQSRALSLNTCSG